MLKVQPWLCLRIAPLLCAFACGDPPQVDPPRVDPQNVEQEVRAMFQAYGDAMREEGLLGELPFLDTSDVFFWVPPGYAGPIGIDSVRATLQRNAPSLQSMDPQWQDLRVNALSDTLAVYTGHMRAITVNMEGDTTQSELLETGVVVKRADGWKLLCGQTAVAPDRSFR